MPVQVTTVGGSIVIELYIVWLPETRVAEPMYSAPVVKMDDVACVYVACKQSLTAWAAIGLVNVGVIEVTVAA